MTLPTSTETYAARVGFLVAAVATAVIAVWVFYVHPWLGLTTAFDRWLDPYGCLFSSLCAGPLAAVSQPGLLAAFLAVALSAAAFWQSPSSATANDGVIDSNALIPHSRWIPALRQQAFVLCLWLTAYQAIVVLAGGTPPAYVWLTAVAGGVQYAALCDAASSWAAVFATLWGLSLAASIALIVLGAACIGGETRSGTALLIGGIVVAVACRMRVGSQRRTIEYGLILALTLLALAQTMSRAWSWHFAFIGDEWGFFLFARRLLHVQEFPLLGLPYHGAYHSNLSSWAQAWVMRAAGENIYGWRLSSVLPFVLSVPPLYVFIRWLAGAEAAALGAALFAASHMLQMFSLVPYNNTQALLPLTLGLGFFAWTAERPSVLGNLLTGMAVGLSVFAYGLARLAVIPLGILVLAYSRRSRRFALPAALRTAFGAMVIATPMLFNLSNWNTMLRATPVHSEGTASFAQQLTTNAVWGLLAFLRGTVTSHNVSGPHTDPLTAALVLIGLGYILANLGSRALRTWFLASAAFTFAVCVVQQYPLPSHTRMFILPVVYAVYAGIGGSATVRLLLPRAQLRRWAVIAVLMLAGFVLNRHHIEHISLAQSAWTLEDRLVQELQATAAPDGGGLKTFIILGEEALPRNMTMVRAYDIGRERLVYLTSSEALKLPDLCSAGSQPAMALIHALAAPVEQLRARIATCWPGYEETRAESSPGAPGLIRFVTAAGRLEIERLAATRASNRQHPDTLAVPDPSDLAIDRHGNVYVLTLGQPRVHRFDAAGRPGDVLVLEQDNSSALALTPAGLLLVASTGTGSHLIWYDSSGRPLKRAPASLAVRQPRGLAVAADGETVVADDSGRIVCFSDSLDVTCDLPQAEQPISIAWSTDKTFWVAYTSGRLARLSRSGEVLATLDAPPQFAARPWRFFVDAGGELVIAEPEGQRVIRRRPTGELLQVWSGFDQPVAAATDASGRLLVSDLTLDEVAIVPARIERCH